MEIYVGSAILDGGSGMIRSIDTRAPFFRTNRRDWMYWYRRWHTPKLY